MHQRLIRALAVGEPLQRIWPIYIAVGAIMFSFLSVPSIGVAVVLIPLFAAAGVTILYGCTICPRRDNRLAGRRMTSVGLAIMILASWTRAVLLWDLTQRGAGSNFLASAVWLWITAGCAALLISVWTRGLG